MRDRSTKKLVKALIAENAPSALVEKARRDCFHDFKSRSATPIVDLVLECERAGLKRLAQRARDGDFDATREEAERWAQSPEGRAATFSLLVGGSYRMEPYCEVCGVVFDDVTPTRKEYKAAKREGRMPVGRKSPGHPRACKSCESRRGQKGSLQ